MRLTALSLQGFKSFAERTRVEFTPGITAVVGPNGSGKSNLIDALKWASGGGRAAEFRAGEKTELIFHGAAGKRSLGYAEVELEVEGPRGRVRVSRSLYRDGTGHLRLDGRNARFLDIDDALAGSGLGRGSLAIIGQGEVSGVLMADPGKLLQYVAEGAGVARLASRRDQTEERLAQARGHLERLADLQEEQRRLLERLRRDAEDAGRHAELSRAELRLRFTLARLRHDALHADRLALEQQVAAHEQRLSERRQGVHELRRQLAERRRILGESERRFREAMAEGEARRGDLRLAQAQQGALEQRLEALERQRQAQLLEAESLRELAEPEAPQEDPAALELELKRAAAGLARLTAARAELEAEARRANDRYAALKVRAAELAQRREAYLQRREALERELRELTAKLAEPALAAPLPERLEAFAGRCAELRSELEATASGAVRLRKELEAAQAEHAHAQAEAQARQRAFERSKQAFEDRRGYAHGPRSALTSGIPGVLGAVADLLRVGEEYREAIAAALGRRLEYVVVDSADTGRAVLEHVRRSGGFVTALPLELVSARPAQLSERLRSAPGVVGLAADLVGSEPRFHGLVHQLLGNTTLISSLSDAVALARRERQRPRLVTMDGDILEGYGAMSGGRRQAQAGVLGAAAELEEAEEAATAAAERAELALEALVQLQQRMRARLEQEAQRRQALEEAQAELAGLRESAAAQRQLREELAQRRSRLERDLEELVAPEGAPAGSEDEALEQLQALEAELAELRRQIEEEQRCLAEARQAQLVAAERLRAYREAQERHRRDLSRREALAAAVESLGREREQLRAQAEQARRAVTEATQRLPGDLDEVEAGHARAQAQAAAAEEGLGRAEAELQELSQELERLRLNLARREAALDAAAAELSAFPAGVEPLEGAERSLRGRLAETSAALAALGAVNHRAAEEFAAESERHEALRSEIEAAEAAIGELAANLQRIERETGERLESAVAAVRRGFRVHVAELFGATAEADIEVEREDGMPVGIRIRLQPPGKQTRQLNLLSVGERTMGAMAFLFALSGEGTQGLPIAVLDEVDAPLDEANIRRFCHFLQRLAARGTQFILITHQKATFEVADALWGVTTEQGVSRIFSIARAEPAPS